MNARICRPLPAISIVALASIIAVNPLHAAPIVAPEFAGSYSITTLNNVVDADFRNAGLTILPSDTNKLLIVGESAQAASKVHIVGLNRDPQNHITGFTGPATQLAAADKLTSGLAFGPGGILFATSTSSKLYQFRPGSSAPDKTVDLAALGVAAEVGTVAFVPGGFPAGGLAKVLSYSTGQWYNLSLEPDGTGLWNVLAAVPDVVTTPLFPGGIAYVPIGSPLFTVPSVLMNQYIAGEVAVFDVDANGNANPATRRLFADDHVGSIGSTIDPVTGDLLISQFTGGVAQVFLVRGFVVPVVVTTTTTTTLPTTTTTTLPGCSTSGPVSEPAGLTCAIAGMQITLGPLPQPECDGPGRCNCKNRDALGKMTADLSAAVASTSTKPCKKKLKIVRKTADVLFRQVGQQAKRNCLAAGARRDMLIADVTAVRERARGVQKGTYCTAR
jgi:hypothetical protein